MKKGFRNIKERVEAFLNSDTGYATATKVVLAVLALGGVVLVGAMAPNIFQIFGKFQRGRKYSPEKLRNNIYTLKRRGYVEIIKEEDNKLRIKLTSRGRERIKEFSTEEIVIPKPGRWDGKWRIVIFDIPNKFTRAREALRRKLKEFDFYQLQKSAWIYPYPCEDEILFICHIFKIEPFVEILTVEDLLQENRIKKFFNL